MNLCYGCMNLKENTDECSICGYTNNLSVSKTYCLTPGFKLSNKRYELGKVLGSGGFGITYIAYDHQKNIRVAIKEYFPKSLVKRQSGEKTAELSNDNQKNNYEKGMLRFQREAEMLISLNNFDKIVKVKNYFKENNTMYIVMEYVQGYNLKDYIKNNPIFEKKLSVQNTMQLFLPLMDVLESLHNKNVFHRDISLDNIIITKNNSLKLIDFGSAKQITSMSDCSNVTVSYKSGYTPPEQFEGSEPGAWNDIYSLAASMYKVITGENPPLISENHLLIDWSGKRPSDLGISIEKNVESALIKALEPDKSKRFDTIREFKNALINDFITVTINNKESSTSQSSNNYNSISNQETVTSYENNYNQVSTNKENSSNLFVDFFKNKIKIILSILIICFLIILILGGIYAKDYINFKNKLSKIDEKTDSDPKEAYDQYSDFIDENKFSSLDDTANEKKDFLKKQGNTEYSKKIANILPDEYTDNFKNMYNNCVNFIEKYPFCDKCYENAIEIKGTIEKIEENNETINDYIDRQEWFEENKETLNQMIRYSNETMDLVDEGAVILDEMLEYETDQVIENVNFNSMNSAYANIDYYINNNLSNAEEMLYYIEQNKEDIIENGFFNEEEYDKYTVFVSSGIVFSMDIYDFYTDLTDGTFNNKKYESAKLYYDKMDKVSEDVTSTMDEKKKYIDDFEKEVNDKITENKDYYDEIVDIVITIQ